MDVFWHSFEIPRGFGTPLGSIGCSRSFPFVSSVMLLTMFDPPAVCNKFSCKSILKFTARPELGRTNPSACPPATPFPACTIVTRQASRLSISRPTPNRGAAWRGHAAIHEHVYDYMYIQKRGATIIYTTHTYGVYIAYTKFGTTFSMYAVARCRYR